jgi:hypothetical protein
MSQSISEVFGMNVLAIYPEQPEKVLAVLAPGPIPYYLNQSNVLQ